jgi:uncharacterized protein YgbK (DUF1537 family)
VAGTRQGETAAQIAALARGAGAQIIAFKVGLVERGESPAAVEDAFAEAAEWLRGGPDCCIIAVDSMFRRGIAPGSVSREEGGGTGEALSAALGELTRRLMETYDFQAVFSAGGDTSLGVCRALGAAGIEPVAEIRPGIPLGKIAGGPFEGRFIITKSGRFGSGDALLEIRDFFRGRNGK